MAGGKETPRQKMIGMMYLVLTALLALQVSNAVLEKFAIINETLVSMIGAGTAKNQEHLEAILKDGSKSSDPKVKRAVENAQKVRDLTTSTLTYLDGLKKTMMEKSGADKVDEKLINDHSSTIATMMMDQQSPVGKEFEGKLKDYEKQIRDLTGGKAKFEALAKAPKDIPIFASDEDHVRKDFLTFTFENTPAIAAIASVTQVQTEILEIESIALDHLAAEAGARVLKVDRVVPMVRAVSNTVAAGAPYEADLFMAASSSALSPTMTVDGRSIVVEDDKATGLKMGRVKFTAQGGGYDEKGIAKRTLVAKISLPDTTYTQNIEYFVAKPTIKITTGARPTLYMNCGNEVNIEVPSLGTSYNPSFSITGGELVKGQKIGNVTIIPNQKKVNVTVNNAGTNLGTEQFDVKNVPRFRIVARDNSGRNIDSKNGVKSGAISGFKVNADADENFKAEVPKDAVYKIREMTVYLIRGTQQVQAQTLTTEIIDLSAWRALMRPGDRIVVEPKKVVRMTYKGTPEQQVVTGSDIVGFPIN